MTSLGARILGGALRLVPGSVRGYIRKVPGLAAAQRAVIATFANREFEHTIDYGPAKGLRMPVQLPRDKEFWKGTYEWEFCNRLRGAVHSGDVCHDIGAFRGYTSGVMALAGASRVLAFEPAPENQKAIRRVLELNSRAPIELIPSAVGDTSGRAFIVLHEDPSMNRVEEGLNERSGIEVNLCSVDGVVSRGVSDGPQLLKIDVEGAEASVLRGASAALRTAVREVFIEIHHAVALTECVELLNAAGFVETWASSDNMKFPVQMNFSKNRLHKGE